MALATGAWAARVIGPQGELNRPAYTFLVLERLREALRRRDIYAPISRRWADPEPDCWTGPPGKPAATRSRSASAATSTPTAK